jgi:hypothetical protein
MGFRSLTDARSFRTEPNQHAVDGSARVAKRSKVSLQLLQTLWHPDPTTAVAPSFTVKDVTQETCFHVCLWRRTIPHSCSQGIFPAVDQTWYADDAVQAASSTLSTVCKAPRNRTTLRLFSPEPTKSTLSYSRVNFRLRQKAFADCEFIITTGKSSIPGFIGEKDT